MHITAKAYCLLYFTKTELKSGYIIQVEKETFERRLAQSVTVIIVAWSNFVLLQKYSTANVLKCKANLNLIPSYVTF